MQKRQFAAGLAIALGLTAAVTSCKNEADEQAKIAAAAKAAAGQAVQQERARAAAEKDAAEAQAKNAANATAGATAAPQHAAPAPACMPCSSQEDFDLALKKGSKCCPTTACHGDADCTGGRVCCKIPGGQLCADSGRCAKSDRVQSSGAAPAKTATPANKEDFCRKTCPGDEFSHCFCSCMGTC